MKKKYVYLAGKRLTKRVRRFIMGLLFSAFFIISPLTILYTAGFRFDFDTYRVIQTGVLSIDVQPTDASVLLNNIPIQKKIPIRITNRTPGIYHLSIIRNGYIPWEKDIMISSNQTTYIKDVTLLKQSEPELLSLDLENIINIFGSQYNPNILLLSHQAGVYEIGSYTSDTDTYTSIIRTSVEPFISISPFNDTATIFVPTKLSADVHIFSLQNPEQFITHTIQNLHSFQWVPTTEDGSLYIQEKNSIQRISALSNNVATVTSTITPVWYIDASQQMWTYNNHTLTNHNQDTTYTILEPITKIIHINNNRVIAQSETKSLVYKFQDGRLILHTTVEGTSTYFHRQTREWWLWSDWELYSAYEDAGINLLNRNGEQIKNVMLLDPQGVVLFSTKQNMTTFNPGYYVGHTLLDEPSEHTYVNLKKRTLYFIRVQNGVGALYKRIF